MHCLQRSATIQGSLDEYLPGWRDAPEPQRVWPEIVAELHAFLQDNSRLPPQNGDTADECRLGDWLSTQRVAHHRGELGAERGAWLNANIPGREGRGPRELVWQQTARELGAWVAETSRWPTTRSADADVNERRFASWLKNRREDLRAGRMSAQRVALLDQCAPGWRK